MNYSVLQGFPGLGKAVTTHVKNTIFFTCVWYRQPAADTSLAFRATQSGWWMNNKAFAIHGRLSESFRIMAAKTLTKSVSLTDSNVQIFLEG